MSPNQTPVEKKGVLTWLREGLRWRWYVYGMRARRFLGVRETQWARVVMDRASDAFVRKLDYASAHALEISGSKWQNFGFASYRAVSFPAYDVCERPLEDAAFDIVIAEQVLEHVLWPYRAIRNVWSMLRPGGWFVVTTPFLFRVHYNPVDCSRWTEMGIKHLLAEGGFDLNGIETGSWGNRSCVKSNFRRTREWIPWWHSLHNEPDYPIVIWAFARKGLAP